MKPIALVAFLFSSLVFAKHGSDDVFRTPTSSLTTDSVSPTVSSTTMVSPSPTSSPGPLQLLTPANATTCQDMTFLWTFSGIDEIPLTITIRGQPTPDNSSSARSDNDQPISRILLTNAVSTDQQFVWNPVDVLPGHYIVSIVDTAGNASISSQSSFFVEAGPDTSCLIAASSSSSTLSTGALLPTTIPTSDATSSKRLSKGDKIGVIVGVAMGVLILIGAFVVPRMWKHISRRHAVEARPGGPYYLF